MFYQKYRFYRQLQSFKGFSNLGSQHGYPNAPLGPRVAASKFLYRSLVFLGFSCFVNAGLTSLLGIQRFRADLRGLCAQNQAEMVEHLWPVAISSCVCPRKHFLQQRHPPRFRTYLLMKLWLSPSSSRANAAHGRVWLQKPHGQV